MLDRAACATSAGMSWWSLRMVEHGSEDQVRKMVNEAIGRAFQNHVELLFANMIKDGDVEAHQRAARGLRKAIAAYRDAIAAVGTQSLK